MTLLERQARTEMVGREPELAALQTSLVAAAPRVRAALIVGPPGIGKTTLWQEGIELARAHGARVLVARPSEPEARFSLSVLADLLEDIEGDVVATLPDPQRHALDVLLLRTEAHGSGRVSRAVAAAVRSVLRELSRRCRVVVAIDDVQWVDPESATALSFAARRLREDDVCFLLAQRAGSTSSLARVAESLDLRRIDVGAVSLGATRRILSERLGVSLPRRALRRVFEATQGNPLFALEVGRALADSGFPDDGDEIPVPASVDELLGLRIARFGASERRALLAVALGGDLPKTQLERIVEPSALDAAEQSGLLVVETGRVRAWHPLLAATARSRASSSERRAMHLQLAGVVDEESLRLRHLAIATDAPDEDLAARATEAASVAAARGAVVNAAELYEQALRLTPGDSPARPDRLLALCELLMVAGEPERATELLALEIERLPPGPARGRAHLMLADGRSTPVGLERYGDHLERALAESEADPGLHARATARRSRFVGVALVERLAEAEAWSFDALPAAKTAGVDTEREVLHGLAWARVLRGKPIDDLSERFRALSDDTFEIFRSLDRIQAERYAYRGEIDRARSILTDLLALADERGEDWSYTHLRMNLAELAMRGGEWDVAATLLGEWERSDTATVLIPPRARCHAALAAGRGDVETAELRAAEAIGDPLVVESRWHVFEVQRARATAGLAAGRALDAVAHLAPMWRHLEREGVDDPGVFPIAPDLVEALAATGAVDAATEVVTRLRRLAVQQEHPWALATAKRCESVVRLASGVDEDLAVADLEAAAAEYSDLGLRFDHARSLLALGRAQRRIRHWASARDALEHAAAAFDEQGSPGWAEVARADLGRLGGRRPKAAGALTPSEQRVVELAAGGLSNKEIAATLFVTVHTVEVHLSHAYAKLGVRSRTQLARSIASGA